MRLAKFNAKGNQLVRQFSSVPSWASIDPLSLGETGEAHQLRNFVDGKWSETEKNWNLVCPLTGNDKFIHMPDTKIHEVQPFIASMKQCPKSGLHNPFKNPERYNLYGDICFNVSREIAKPEVEDFFTNAIRKVMPKSDAQARGEVKISNRFLQNFCGDNVRFLAKGFNVSGDHLGQISNGYRYPYGPVALIVPFNFPFEIPVLQMMGALFMGNKLLLKGSEKTSLVVEEFVRLLLHCGMPKEDLNLIHCHGETMEHLLCNSNIRLTQFTGSSTVADHIAKITKGKVKVEDAGFDWKILGPDAPSSDAELNYIAHISDQDAYAMSGQKCSAQSMLIMHENYEKKDFVGRIRKLAAQRTLANTFVSPLLSITNDMINAHIKKLLELEGAQLLFGEEIQENHTIPDCYGSFLPTAVFVPLKSILSSEEATRLATTEIFGPFQVVTTYTDNDINAVIDLCEKMDHHLTAAVVSNDQPFLHKILGNTVNGTTYAGIRARTTGAPANHWFGPAGDPRGAGIGSPEAIRLVWSCHREVVNDYILPANLDIPKQS